MSTALKDHRVLSRRRLTSKGWVTVFAELAGPAEERPALVDHGDPLWPENSKRPVVCHLTVVRDREGRMVGLADPVDPAWWDNGWPQQTSPDRRPAVWAQMELGTRVVGELLRPNRHTPQAVAA